MGGAAVEAHEKTRTRLDPQLRRSQIVEAAVRVFSETDPVEVTFEEIAEAAGVSRALVYNYFGDRGGLVAAVYLHTFHELNEHLNTAMDPDAPPEERLRTIVRGYLRFAVEHAAAWRLLQMTGALNHPAVQSARQRHMERLALAWGADGPEGRTLAYGVVGMLESATFDWLRDRDTDIGRLGDLIFDFLWTGLSSLDRHGIALPHHRSPESVPT
jgi:AcrR family transcriptional regulator